MKKKWVCFIFLFILTGVFASSASIDDPSVICRTLDNGFTYYIKKNSFPEKRASLRLVVHAGSLHEEENQRGVAHFVEHMLFRGSKHFADWEVINFLETIGAEFGPDTNAFTTFDHTIYQLELPLEKKEVLEKGILICSDWAARANLSDELIEKERTVIMDEFNQTTKNSQSRQAEKFFQTFLPKSRYTNRMPIGLREVILHCDPQLIRDFYQKWYRPDRMALIAVGDFEEEEIVEFVTRYFGNIERPEQVLTEPDTALYLDDQSHVEIFQDNEQMINIGLLCDIFDHAEDTEKTQPFDSQALQENLYQAIFSQVLNNRLQLKVKEHNAPFVGCSPFNLDVGRLGIRGFSFIPYESRPYEGVKGVLREVSRLITYGPTEEEFEEARANLYFNVSNRIKNLHRTSHNSYVGQLVDNFLVDLPVHNLEKQLQFREQQLMKLSREGLLANLQDSTFEPYKHIVFEVSDSHFLDKSKLEEAIEEWMKEDVVDQIQVEMADLKIAEVTKDDVIVKEYKDQKHGYETLIFPNGFKVVMHPTQLTKGEVLIELCADGGKNLLKKELYPSVGDMTALYAKASGLANLNGTQLENYLQRKNFFLNYMISANQRIVAATSTDNQAIQLLDVIYAAFYQRQRDPVVWQNIVERQSEVFRHLQNDPYMAFHQKIRGLYYQHAPFYELYSPEQAQEEDATYVIDQLFGDINEFTLFITGDFSTEEIKKHLVHLFGSEQRSHRHTEKYIPFDEGPKEKDDQIIYQDSQVHSRTIMIGGGPFHYLDKKFSYINQAFDQILQMRLMTRIRQELGDTYQVTVSTGFPFYPNLEKVDVVIGFASEPERSKSIVATIREEITRLIEQGPVKEEVEKVRTMLRERKRLSLLSNSGLLQAHETANFLKISFQEVLDYQAAIEKEVTAKRVQKFAQALFNDQRHLIAYTLCD